MDEGDPAKSERLRSVALESLDEVLAEGGDAVQPVLSPHAIYTVSSRSLEWIAETSAERQIPVQIHLSETQEEVQGCLEAHGMRPAEYLDRVGLLGPRTILAHCVWLDGAELELIAERGATIAANPVANLKLAVGGVFPYLRARELGIPVGLGTDGAGSNNSLDLLADSKFFALLQKNAAGDAAAVTAEEAFEVATGQRSELLTGWPGEDTYLLVRGAAPELSLGDLEAGLVYAASGSVVDSTVVDGRELMKGGAVEDADEVVARARERAQRLGLT
jgi:5-methylthioadenosine/S-adenosylhomocysteine deaminase